MQSVEDERPILKSRTPDEKLSAALTAHGPELLDEESKTLLFAITEKAEVALSMITVTLVCREQHPPPSLLDDVAVSSRDYTMTFILELFRTKNNTQASIKYHYVMRIIGRDNAVSIQPVTTKKINECMSDLERREVFKEFINPKELSLLMDNVYRPLEGKMVRVYTRLLGVFEYGPEEWFMVLYGIKKF